MSNEDLILRGIKLEILRDKRHEIVKSLNPARHYDYLRSKYLLSGEDVEEIQRQETQTKRASLFLDKIMENGPNDCYDLLCQSFLVADKTRMHLLTMLNKEYENKFNNYKVLMKTQQPRSQTLAIAVDPSDLPRPPRPGSNPNNDMLSYPGPKMNIPPDTHKSTSDSSHLNSNILGNQEPYNDLSSSFKE